MLGAAISGSFLFIFGVANSIILYGIIKQRRTVRIEVCLSNPTETTQNRVQIVNSAVSPAADEEDPSVNDGHLLRSRRHGNTLLMKIIGPVITFVDRPWKVSILSTWHKREFRPKI